MATSMDEISIRCMGCNESLTLEKAVKKDWKMCENCNFSICSFCFELLDNMKCLSYICSPNKLEISPIPLPIEKIIVYAQQHSQEDYKKGLLYKLFYQEQEKLHAPPFLTLKEKKQEVNEEYKPSKIQEETWKNFQLVVTKRRGGKFISWERVIS